MWIFLEEQHSVIKMSGYSTSLKLLLFCITPFNSALLSLLDLSQARLLANRREE